jgi:NAD(P)-dependent dehydrogenase (short-subunit alcohol dehydrogenase family)
MKKETSPVAPAGQAAADRPAPADAVAGPTSAAAQAAWTAPAATGAAPAAVPAATERSAPRGRLAQLRGAVAVVSGGASGLGEATVAALVDAGLRVAVLDRDAARVAQVSARHADAGSDRVAGWQVDVTDGPGMERTFDAIAERLGRVSVLVNCAGIAEPGSVVRHGQPMPLAEFQRVVHVNLLGTLNCIRCAVPQMIEGRQGEAEAGVIVNTASIAATEGQVGQAAYAASKGGVAGLVLPLARELGEHGIRVMGISPGVFETPMTLSLPEKSRATVFAARPPYPLRAGQAHEFAQLVLAVIDNPMLNGEVIRLDGGLRMPARL